MPFLQLVHVDGHIYTMLFLFAPHNLNGKRINSLSQMAYLLRSSHQRSYDGNLC